MSEVEKPLVPEGYKLILRKKMGCPLCQRPELRGSGDEVIWSRKYNPLLISRMFEEKNGFIFTPQEIMFHSKHFELISTNQKEIKKEKQNMLTEIIEKEKDMIKINKMRETIDFDFDKDVEGKIKALSAEITELKASGFDKDEFYLKKIKEYKALCEMRYKTRDEIKEGNNISLAVLEVRDLFDKLKKVNETKEAGKNEQPTK